MHAKVARRVSLVVSLLVGLACTPFAVQPAFAQAPAKSLGSLVLGSGIDASYASIVVGVRKGFFKNHGIDAELKVFASGQEALDAVLTGQAGFRGQWPVQHPARGGQGRQHQDHRRVRELDPAVRRAGREAGIGQAQDLIRTKDPGRAQHHAGVLLPAVPAQVRAGPGEDQPDQRPVRADGAGHRARRHRRVLRVRSARHRAPSRRRRWRSPPAPPGTRTT